MTPSMVDTQVLSFAIVAETPTDPDTARTQRDATALVKSLGEIRVSSDVVLELMRGPPTVVAKVRRSGILDQLYVEPVDAAVSLFAAELLEKARNRKDACPRCFNITGATACPKCGQQVSHQQKMNDALIVATASVLGDVKTLYSYDKGVLKLGEFVKNITVCHPPNLDGPLFSGT